MKGLELIKKKTVIVVVRKDEKLREEYEFRFKDDFIQIKKEFVQLGVKFLGNGKYEQEVKHRVQRGNMCKNLILKSQVGKIRDLTMCKYLFRTKFLPVMDYW